MLTLSPPVSPSVVARILMIQNPSVTAGTFVSASRAKSRSFMRLPPLAAMLTAIKSRTSTEAAQCDAQA
jgi:hypothetical protein